MSAFGGKADIRALESQNARRSSRR